DVSEVEGINYQQLQLISLPFRIIGTMGAIVVLELFFRRGRTRGDAPGGRGGSASHRDGPLPRRGLLLRPAVLARAIRVSRILTRHGLAPLVGWGSGRGARLDAHDLARRARQAFEEAGGVFVKLGQLLATRPDLLPPPALA